MQVYTAFPVTKFCADEQYIYGVCNKEDENVIYRFKILALCL